MSYITRTGNLASTPVLREGEKGVYAYARVLVSDRIREGEEWTDGPTIGYDVSVSGAQAAALVDVANRCGNIRITFSGEYRVTEYIGGEGDAKIQHEVRADDIAVSLRGQSVTVEKTQH